MGGQCNTREASFTRRLGASARSQKARTRRRPAGKAHTYALLCPYFLVFFKTHNWHESIWPNYKFGLVAVMARSKADRESREASFTRRHEDRVNSIPYSQKRSAPVFNLAAWPINAPSSV